MSILNIPKAVGVIIASFTFAFCAGQVGTPAAAPASTTVVTTTAAPITTQPPTTTAPTTTLPDLSGVDFTWIARDIHGKCGEWHDLAMAVGWPAEEWPTLSYVLYRESRCNIDSWNKTDPHSGSRGLMQINGFWCRPNRYDPNGFLQSVGVLNNCEDLFDPVTNLRAGLAIWTYGENKHGCGWRGPWATSCNKYTVAEAHP